jgi:FKBP-type peptidyl-prolyl cis-trans isomerase 2|tara:strand:- start:1903 stop:2568 length:666 start_codon:yes stop_codon:yes gene_type:complete
MTFKQKDFIEVEFTGKVKDGEIFDSNIKKDLEDANLDFKPKPFIFCLGEGMFLKGVEDFLIGKEIGEYNVELSPEKAFGKREPKLIQVMPMKIFREQKLNPIQGTMFNFDGRLAKILSVSGGRVIADFNNPIAGKDVVYKIKILRKVEDIKEKTKALIEFLFKRDLDFEVKEKKIIIKVEKELVKFVELFKDKFKDILGLDLEVKEVQKKKEEDKEKDNKE